MEQFEPVNGQIRLLTDGDRGSPMRPTLGLSTGIQTALGVEFLALSSHRKAIRDKLAGSTGKARDTQARLLEKATGWFSAAPDDLTPTALTTILVSVGRLLSNKERVGITKGHDEVRGFVDWALTRLVEPAKRD